MPQHSGPARAILALLPILVSSVLAVPQVVDTRGNVTFQGVSKNGVEQFLNIPYGQAERFSNPQPRVLPPGTVYDASKTGPVCPQRERPGTTFGTPATPQSEDCLRLKVARPEGIAAGAKIPVMVYMYGGSAVLGHINDIRTEPEGLIQQSVANGLPVISVSISYRLSIFGFPVTEPLKANNSVNLGLKDQRLALEWVQQNIAYFGGDPERVTLFGQSTGAQHTAIQMLAYGGTKPMAFHRAIMQSTTLQNDVASNLTRDTYNSVTELAGCVRDGNPQSSASLECLRALPVAQLLDATLTQLQSTASDVYLPTIDGDFLPEAPSSLVKKGLFPKIRVMAGWTQNDLAFFVPFDTSTADDTRAFIRLMFSTLRDETIDHIGVNKINQTTLKTKSTTPIFDRPSLPHSSRASKRHHIQFPSVSWPNFRYIRVW